jgi:hypothetical protein
MEGRVSPAAFRNNTARAYSDAANAIMHILAEKSSRLKLERYL